MIEGLLSVRDYLYRNLLEEGESKFCTKIKNRVEDLKRYRQPWEEAWKEIMESIDPYYALNEIRKRANIKGIIGGLEKSKTFCGSVGSLIRTSTLILNSQLLDPSVKWLDITFPLQGNGQDLTNIKAVQDYQRNCTNSTYEYTNSSKSNFHPSSTQVISTAFHIGTGIRYLTVPSEDSIGMSASGQNNGLKFSSIDPRDFVFDVNGYEELSFAARDIRINLEQAQSLWGDIVIQSAYPNSTEMMDGFNKYNLYSITRKYLHVVIPNYYRMNPLDENIWLEVVIDEAALKIIAVGGLKQMPYIVWRFFHETGELYGRSPLYYLAKEIKESDKYIDYIRKAADYSIHPAWLLRMDSQIKKSDIMPGAFVRNGLDERGQPTFTKLPMGEGLQVAQQLVELKKTEVAEGLIIRDLAQQFNEPGMTETLVAEKRNAQDNRIKPIISRWEREDIEPTVKYILRWLTNEAKIEGFPYLETGIDEEEMPDPIESLNIRYGGMLGRQQDQYEDYKMNVFMTELANLDRIQGNVYKYVDKDKLIESKAKIKKFSYDIMMSAEERQEIEEQEAAAAAAQEEAAVLEQAKQIFQ